MNEANEVKERKRMGRPPSANPIVYPYQIRTREGELKRWREAAAVLGVDLPQFIRSTMRQACEQVEEDKKKEEERKHEDAVREAKRQVLEEYNMPPHLEDLQEFRAERGGLPRARKCTE